MTNVVPLLFSDRKRIEHIYSFAFLEQFIKSFELSKPEKWFARKMAEDVGFYGGASPNIPWILLTRCKNKLSPEDANSLAMALCKVGVIREAQSGYEFACGPEPDQREEWLKWYSEEYLKSDHWHTVRQRALDFAEHRCQLCDSDYQLQVHHRSYRTLYKEQASDVIVLCRTCHAAFHERLR